MADISITAANVISREGSTVTRGTAGATITAGHVVYFDDADSRFKMADNNSATAIAREPRGIALNGASAGQPIAVHEKGSIVIGGTLTPGVAYYLSATPGHICPVADLAAGNYPTIMGIATSATVLNVDIQMSGVAL